jgi:hypothetical protein
MNLDGMDRIQPSDGESARKTPDGRKRVSLNSITNRSAVTNGKSFLPGLDGRSSIWVRRCKDLIALHVSDLGGESNMSEAEMALVRRVATLTVELEMMELKFATVGESDPKSLEVYGRTVNTLRRTLESIGLKRVPRDITPSVAAYVASRQHDEAAE